MSTPSELIVAACSSCGAGFERLVPSAVARASAAYPLCDECWGAELVDDQGRLAARDEAEERERETSRRNRLERRRKQSGIPYGLQALEWSEVGPAVAVAQRWAAGELPGLVLSGPVGVGKTHLAAAAAWRYLERARLRWTTASALMLLLNADFGSDEHERGCSSLTAAHALVIDDLDKVKPTDHAAAALLEGIDSRIAGEASLLITTNLTLDELERRFGRVHGQAIASRLAGYCTCLQLAGADRRLTGRAAA